MNLRKKRPLKLSLWMNSIFLAFILMVWIGCANRGPWWDHDLISARTSGLNESIGKHKSEWIMRAGPPTRIQADGKGGEILSWELKRREALRIHQSRITKDYTVSQTGGGTVLQLMIYADKEGQIYWWRYKDPSGSYSPKYQPEFVRKAIGKTESNENNLKEYTSLILLAAMFYAMDKVVK